MTELRSPHDEVDDVYEQCKYEMDDLQLSHRQWKKNPARSAAEFRRNAMSLSKLLGELRKSILADKKASEGPKQPRKPKKAKPKEELMNFPDADLSDMEGGGEDE